MVQRTTSVPRHEDPWAQLGDRPLPAPPFEADVARRSSIIYTVVPGFRPLELDLYTPADGDGSPRPAVMWIHGGAFALGTRQIAPAFLEEADFFATLVRAGFVVASIDYRLSGEAQWPAQLLDVRTAVRWLRSRSAELAIDPESIAVWGESAGAHLAAMAGVLGGTGRDEEPVSLELPRVAAVVDWYGPTDFRQMDVQAAENSAMAHDDPESPESRLVGAPVQEAGAIIDDANPVTHVTADAPPFLIRHGELDRLVAFGQSVLLAERLAEVGADVTLHAVPGAGHVFEGHPAPGEFIAEAIEFLSRVLPTPPCHRADDLRGHP
ncbi:hypothetical protein GCM10022382_15570 [Microbacterium invictum]